MATPTTVPAAGRGPAGADAVRAGLGIRLGAFAIDAAASDLVARLFAHQIAWWNALVLFCEYLVLLSVGGQTFGMWITRIRVVSERGRLRPQWVLVRTVLLFLLVPALITDRTGRGLHDRAAGTVVVRA